MDRDLWLAMTTIALSTVGSACVELEVTPAALEEAAGGVSIWIVAWKGTAIEEQLPARSR